ncbi:MAG: 16S rRNA (guanine(966)-N(2))-methyltransferase RsmD [Prevotellaceae bacterium]|jgi:16S rRNA (guanine(966)-N(2))-methyltransferase RsmD|nr:16S rRNA (guanine(966)-N(2))-methyltransferase RsmD [Prevotellaceae bacterium]
MRIISGKFKGLRFEPPKDITARPTTDFAKESLFNVLGNYIDFEDVTVLDLFAGTGSISYEFISRGAKSVTAIEMSNTQINFIKKTINNLKINNLRVYKSEVFRYLEKCGESYDLIFADPPYQMLDIDKIPALIFNNNLLKISGIFVLEHGKNLDFSEHKNFLEQRNYGNVHFSFFR